MKPLLSRKKFYLLSWTWGLPLNLLGGLVALCLLLLGYSPKRWDYCYYFEIGHNWGGTELGMFFLTQKGSHPLIKCHEQGHGIQNCYWGFLMPFVVSIPSAIRYWYRMIISWLDKERYRKLAPYDKAWFEGQATRLGLELHRQLRRDM